MKGFTSFQFYHNSKSDTLDVVLHGGSYDINTDFMQKVFDTCKRKGHSVIAFNFPYIERGQEQSSGPELKEELATLQKFLDYGDYKSARKIRLIAKSLGGIVASFYLDKLNYKDAQKFLVIILGYVVGSLDKLKNFEGEIAVIQGEKDKFGSIEAVKQDLKGAKAKDIKYFQVPGANHSFRDPETDKPVYVGSAMRILSNLI